MADLRVDVVGTPRQDHDPLAVLPGPGHSLLPLLPDSQHMGLIGGKSGLHGLFDLFSRNAREDRGETGVELLGELPGLVDVQEGGQEAGLLQVVHIAAEKLRVVGHHGAVVVVVAPALVHVVGKAGVEDGVHAPLQQHLHVPVHDLGRITGGVRGDGELSLLIDAPGGEAGDLHLEPQAGKEGVPQGQELIHAQGQGQSDGPPDVRPRPEARQRLPLPGVEAGELLGIGEAQALLALVAGDVLLPAAEAVNGQAAVVGTALTDSRLGGVGEAPEGLRRDEGALLQVHGVQRRAVGPHEPGDGGADDLPAQLHLKGPEDGVVVERAPLDHHMLAQFTGAPGADDLVDGVFHHADGEPGGDVLHRGPVLLGLLDRGVHKHGAPASQVHRRGGVETLSGKLRHITAHGLGEGLDERPAAGGAGLVEHNRINGSVQDLEALDVLPADVENEIHLRAEVLGGGVVGDGLHHALVHAESGADELLAVAGNGAAPDGDPAGAEAVDVFQLLPDDLHRVAPVGAVVGVEQLPILPQQGRFRSGTAAVDAQPRAAGVVRDVPAGDVAPGVAGPEGRVVLLGGEEGRKQVLPRADRRAGLDLPAEGIHGVGPPGVLAVEGRAHGHGKASVLREHRLLVRQLQRLLEPDAQALAVVEGPAQEEDLPPDAPPLGQSGDGLVDHGLVDACGHVGVVGPLIQEGLDVRLGKDAAPGGDGVEPGALEAQLVQLVGGDVQQHGHLIDKGPGAPGAGAVHALVDAAVEEDDLGVLAPQLDDGGGVRLHAPDHFAGGEDLLDEGHPGALRQSQSGGPGDGGGEGALPHHAGGLDQELQGLLPDLGEVALVFFKTNGPVLDDDDLGGGGADVDAQGQLALFGHILLRFPPTDRGRIFSTLYHKTAAGFMDILLKNC